MGDNLIKKSENMPWWTGMDVVAGGKTARVTTLYDALDKLMQPPARKLDAPLRVPLSGVHKIVGVGDVLTGRIEQGRVSPGDEVCVCACVICLFYLCCVDTVVRL
jgi:elongation factor 1-alpha